MDQNTHWSQVGGGVVNAADFATLHDAVNALGAAPAGGTILIPPGTHTISSELNLDGRNSVTLVGMGTKSSPSKILYTGTGGRAIACRSSSAIEIRNLHILYNSGSFTGHVIDFQGTQLLPSYFSVVSDCQIGGETAAAVNAASLINLDCAFTMVIARNNFTGCQYAIHGMAANGFSNAIQVFGNHFSSSIKVCGIREAGQNWLIQGNTFEPLSYDPEANPPYRPVAAFTNSIGVVNTVFDSNWFGDGTAHGTWISWFGSGLTVSNNYISSGSVAVSLSSSSCYGLTVTGNHFAGSANPTANMAVAVDLGGLPKVQTGIFIAGNVFESSVTTPIANLHDSHRQVSISGNFPDSVTTTLRSINPITLQGSSTNIRFPSTGTIAMRDFAGGLDVHVRPDAGKRGVLTFTEDLVADRWTVGTKGGDANLYFGTGGASTSTDRVIMRPDGGVTMTGTPRFNASNTVGAGAASLGANCPAATLSAPYRWIGITTQDGSTAYVPCWK